MTIHTLIHKAFAHAFNKNAKVIVATKKHVDLFVRDV